MSAIIKSLETKVIFEVPLGNAPLTKFMYVCMYVCMYIHILGIILYNLYVVQISVIINKEFIE